MTPLEPSPYTPRVTPQFQEALSAVQRGDVERLRQLVPHGSPLLSAVDDADHPGTLLHHAAGGQHLAVVSTLLDLGAAVDAATWATPLHLAVSYGRTENARRLLEAGAAFDARTRRGTTPLAMAVLHGHPEVADVLRPLGILPRTLWVAAGAGELTLVQSFVHPDGSVAEGAGAHREDPQEYGMPRRPLSGEPEALLAEALQYACANGRSAVVEYLLDAGADIDGVFHVGTPLHHAAYCGQLQMVRHLVQRGADVYARDDEWHGTPASWAEQRSHAAVVELLRSFEDS